MGNRVASRIPAVAAAVLLWASCATSSATALTEDGAQTNTVVFPETAANIERLMVYPGDTDDIVARWGNPVDNRLELIADNAVRHYHAGQFGSAAELWGYALRYAADSGQTLTREQLSNMLLQRAYSLIDAGDASGSFSIWTYQISMWQDDADWRLQLPPGLEVSTAESKDAVGYYLGTSYAERSVTQTTTGQFEAAFDDLREASSVFVRSGHPARAIRYSLHFMTNAIHFEEFGWGLEANPLVSSVMASYPNAATTEDVMRVGRMTAICLIQLGDISSGYRQLQQVVSLAESTGHVVADSDTDRTLMGLAKTLLVQKISSGDYNLQDAVLAEDQDAVRSLLRRGADPNERFDGVTALMILARDSGNPAIAGILLEGGADPDAGGDLGMTALVSAAGYSDNLALVQLLLERGANPNVTSPQGWTPLMMAVRRGSSPGIVEALLSYGANPNAQTVDGLTAVSLAKSGPGRSGEIARLLENARR